MVEVMAERPGIMVYFDMAEPLKVLGYEEKGRLLDAMLDYGQFGVVPEFDGVLTVVWGFIRPKLDADAKSYRKKVVKNTYSSYCAKEKKNGNNTPLDFEEWCSKERIDTSEWTQAVSSDIERYPNTTPNPEITPKANTMTEAKVRADGGGKGEEVPQNETEEQRRQRMIALLGNYHPN
jgi:hypothetical protein